MRRFRLGHTGFIFLCLLLCLPLCAGNAASAPGALLVTRAFERDGAGVILFDAVDDGGNALTLDADKVSLSFGEQPARVLSLETLREADESVATLLLLDTSYAFGSGEKTRLTRAVQQWIEAARPGDKVALVTCGGEAAMRADFVSDHTLLTVVADAIDYGVKGKTLLYDGLRLAAEVIERRADTLPARVAVIAFTDGIDDGSVDTTAEEALALLERLGATLHIVAVGDSPDAAQALAPSGVVLSGSGKGAVPIDDAFSALHDRLLDSYMLRFALDSGTPGGAVYLARLTVRDAAGELLAEGEAFLRAPGGQAADPTTAATPAGPLAAATPSGSGAAVTLTALAVPTDTSPSSPPAPPPTQASTPSEEPGLLGRGLSIWRDLTDTQRLLWAGAAVVTLTLLILSVLLLRSDARKRKQRQQIEALAAGEQRLTPPPQETDVPPVQTNIVMRSPVYQPVSAEPYTHLRQPADGGEASAQGVRVLFRIIGPTGAVENRTFTVDDGFTIGRDPACGLFIKDGRLSKKHLVLNLTADGGLILRNVKPGSVLVNGGKARGDWPLKSGDTLRVGRFSVLVQYSE